jgi:hypothetical protein
MDDMDDAIERAREGIEHAEHAHRHEGDERARWVAVLVAILAAALAITEVGQKTAMVSWLSSHISVSDIYAYYQAKNVRAAILRSEEDVLLSLPDQASPAVQARRADTRKQQARLRDQPGGEGMKQLLAKAQHEELVRAESQHVTHELEYAGGGLQIAILLASISVVTRVRPLAWGGFALGAAMIAYGLAVWAGVVY